MYKLIIRVKKVSLSTPVRREEFAKRVTLHVSSWIFLYFLKLSIHYLYHKHSSTRFTELLIFSSYS